VGDGDSQLARRRAAERAAAHCPLDTQHLGERFPEFAELNQEQRELLLLHFHPRPVQPGERIIRRGDVADAVEFIESGFLNDLRREVHRRRLWRIAQNRSATRCTASASDSSGGRFR
jgi:CRP-like cAMP-binding protein